MIGWLEARLRRHVPDSIPYVDPLRAGRHPFQTFMLVLCVVSSLPLIFGQVTAGTIEDTLPWWGALAWGLSLFLGSVCALVGCFWPCEYDTALFLERVGLNFVGFAAVVYGMVIPLVGGPRGLVAAGIVLGFGASCLIRARDIARIFARAQQQQRQRPRVQREGE